MKLTLINVFWQGKRHSAFVMLPVGNDGKVHLSFEEMLKFCNVNIPRGHCVGICY